MTVPSDKSEWALEIKNGDDGDLDDEQYALRLAIHTINEALNHQLKIAWANLDGTIEEFGNFQKAPVEDLVRIEKKIAQTQYAINAIVDGRRQP